jgi:predicted RNA-binding Zn-ribbon protein involved in translation (DUF1610 family)
MAKSNRPHEDFEARGRTGSRVLVYLPCPGCARAVLLSDETRVGDDPETYECPSCDARFVLSAEPS